MSDSESQYKGPKTVPGLDQWLRDLDETLASGDLSRRMNPAKWGDLDLATKRVNQRLQEIQHREEKLNHYKKSLKAQIDIRTEELKKERDALALSMRESETASQSKSVFLANMSHELRTPLNAIINYSEMLQEDAADSGREDFLPDLERIRTAGKNLLVWVDEIIDLSRIESGRSELNIGEMDIVALVQKVAQEVQPQIAEAENALIVDCPENIGTMRGDTQCVRRVLCGLLNNASKATHKGKVAIKVKRKIVEETHWFHFAVSDSGAGISSKVLETLFKGGLHADVSVSSAYGGTALSLAICHRFSLVMGGNIQAKSELGQGSTFTLCLPAEAESHLAKTHVIRATNRLLSDILNLKKKP